METKICTDTFIDIRKPTKQEAKFYSIGTKYIDFNAYKIYTLKSSKKLGRYWKENDEEAR